MVDPYDWLGLPKSQRPPTPYQLLGLAESVEDLAAIRGAADRQLRRILPHMSGEHALDAERLWTELEEARDLLHDADRRAEFDAHSALSETAPEAADSEPTISADWEEPVTTSSTGPEPWWKSAPVASAESDAWWKQPIPAEVASPPPAPPVSIASIPAAVKLLGKVAPEVAAIGQASRPRIKKTKSLVSILIGGVLVAGGIVCGVYYAFGFLKSKPKIPTDEPIAVLPQIEPKPKKPVRVEPKNEDPVPVAVLPKNFADALRAKTFKGHAGAVNGLAIASTGSQFVSVGTDKTLRIWSVAADDSTLRHTFISPVTGVSWCDKDRRILASDGLTLANFEAAKTAAPRTSDSTKGGVSALGVAADGSRAITGLTDGYLRLWDPMAGQIDEWPAAARGPINSVDISADGSQVLAAVAEGSVTLWNLTSRNRTHEWTAHPGGALAVRFSPDGGRAATSGPEGTATIYDLASKKEICRLDGHAGPVTAIEWLPDGRQVVTVGVDSTARLWSAETGQPLRWNQTLEGKGNAIAVDPSGRFILAGTSTGNIHLFPLPRVKPEVLVGAIAKPPVEPLPIPDPATVTSAMSDVRTELANEFAYARPDDMALLADKLRRRAAREQVSPSFRFGLLQEARALAIRAGDPLTAFKAIEDLAAWFDLDEMFEKAATFATLPTEADGPFLIGVGVEAAERAELDARPEIVTRLLQRLPEKASPNTPAERTARLNAIRNRSAAITTEMKNVLKALAVLKNAADHQDSNHAYGTFLCFTRQDWATGLPHLAKGIDPRMIEAAKTDLSTPLDPKAQHRLGELWYSLAIDAKDHRAKRSMLARARMWFERELKSKPVGISGIKVRERIDDIARQDIASKDPLQLPLFSAAQARRSYNTIAADVIKNEWRFDASSEAKPNLVHLTTGSPILQSRFGLAAGGKLTLSFEPDGREVRVNCAGQEVAFAGSGRSLRLVIERSEDKLSFRAVADDGEPVTKTTDIPSALRSPMFMTIRLTGTAARPGGASLTSATIRGPASLPLPLVE